MRSTISFLVLFLIFFLNENSKAQISIDTEKPDKSPTLIKASLTNLFKLTDMTTDEFNEQVEALGFQKFKLEDNDAYTVGGIPQCNTEIIQKQIGELSILILIDCGTPTRMADLEKELQRYYIKMNENSYAVYGVIYNGFSYEIEMKRTSSSEGVLVFKTKQ